MYITDFDEYEAAKIPRYKSPCHGAEMTHVSGDTLGKTKTVACPKCGLVYATEYLKVDHYV